MNKKLLATLLFLASACTHNDMRVDLSFELYKSALKTDSKSVEVSVIDDRTYTDSIGQKRFGSTTVQITAKQDVVKLLQEKITKNLVAKGFTLGDDFIVKVYLEEIDYQASRGFFVGKSTAYGKIKVSVFSTKYNKEFNKDYRLTMENKYFIVSSAETDSENINNLLQELIGDFLADQEFLNTLAVSNLNDSSLDRLLKTWYMF